ncbi:alpha/beta hydrolase [Tenggerimyces flavus]|uniref:Alpha/beta hydrolase n=1 Tax=Tenggerimyces flavus TaxID=1708749 RepID=A0ABV7Y3G7_9ACTN|nr:alpha/beta fold hydrolase [Tenggerimyces flavus]MBM7788650.1 carboxylesterase [Tenggerimyces flavus]
MQVQPHAVPYLAGDGPVGVLLSHGFTGSPASMRPWAEYLAANGLRVASPRLAGHGTSWQEMNHTGWPDWYASVEQSFLELSNQCETVVVAGQSMGGALVLRLAEQHGAKVAGVIVVNPSLVNNDPRLIALPLLRRITPSFPGLGNDIKKPGVAENAYDRLPLHALASLKDLWREVGAALPRVTQPLLVFRSTVDHVVDGASMRLLRARVGSREIEEHVLHDSYHVATLDNDAPTIFEESLVFVERLVRMRATG